MIKGTSIELCFSVSKKLTKQNVEDKDVLSEAELSDTDISETSQNLQKSAESR